MQRTSSADIEAIDAVEESLDIKIEEKEHDPVDNHVTSDDVFEDVVYVEITYNAFDATQVLERLQLQSLETNRSLENLLNTTLRPSDSLRPFERKNGEGTFDNYMLSINGIDAVEFYPNGDLIDTIMIINAVGVPETMIQPGLAYEDLQKTYENPVAYGSEVESRVHVFIADISFRMDAMWNVAEPVDIEDDTEILWIQF